MTRELQIGEWLVEPDLNRITRDEENIPVEPKVIEVLLCLADYPGEVLSKEQIIQTVWSGTYVSDEVLRYSISELRKAFKDDAKNPRIIQTIARRGYRLIAPVTKKDPSTGIKASVAVLAFSDMSAARDQEYFCEGISEEIINNLTHIKNLRVASRTSSFAFKGQQEDIRLIGKRLNVSAVLEGSVRKAENRLRISVQLINVKDGYPLWSERYDRELKNIFEIQDEIARQIAATLKVKLTSGERDAISKTPTTDLRAYDFYLRGRQFYYQYTRRGIEFALKMFSQAIELDAYFARAYAGISDCCSYLYMYSGNQNTHLKQADSNSLKALEMDPDSAEAHASRGTALFLKKEYTESEKQFEIAIRLDPMLFEAYYFYARSSFVQGELEKAIRLYEKASEVHPQDYQAPLLIGQIYEDLGDMQRADASRRRGVKAAEARLRLNPDDTRAIYMGANGLVATGDIDRGIEWINKALAMDSREPMVLYNVACVQSLAGLADDALDTLETALNYGLSQEGWIDQDSNLDPVRSHPRFKRLIKKFRKKTPAAQ